MRQHHVCDIDGMSDFSIPFRRRCSADLKCRPTGSANRKNEAAGNDESRPKLLKIDLLSYSANMHANIIGEQTVNMHLSVYLRPSASLLPASF